MASRKKTASFTIRIKGDGVTPESIAVRTLSNAASAVTRLAVGEDSDDSGRVRILGVKRGSAAYSCLVDDVHDIERNFSTAGEVVNNPESDKLIEPMLSPMKDLSSIASKFDNGSVEVYVGDLTAKAMKSANPVVSFDANTYRHLESTAIVQDTTTIHGYLVAVGGAGEKKCRIRVPDRTKLLYCSVTDDALSRRLGENLYTYVTVHGRGSFFARTWSIVDFEVFALKVSSEQSIKDILANVNKASQGAWSDVVDVQAEVRSLR